MARGAEGRGNRRGLNPNRSQKLLVLEDGVPVAPGLFLANESYYSPRIERMESIEVLKGAAGLRYGPTTIGGVINYKTKNPEDGVKVTVKGGSHGYRLLGLDAGGKAPSGEAIGYRQWVSAKFSHYDNDINTSYAGLRPNEFRTDPAKNPAPNDFFETARNASDINHELEISPDLKLKTLLYWSQLDRNAWRRDIAARSANGATFQPCNNTVNCMTGRNRAFEMAGIDTRLLPITTASASGTRRRSAFACIGIH